VKKYVLFILLSITSLESFSVSPMIGDRDANWGTHQTPLIAAVMNTDGPILEMGCGDFSTPLLHAICSVKERTLVSADTDKKWMGLFLDLETTWHKFIHVPVFENPQKPQVHRWNYVGNDTHWGVVFIDHHPGPRRAVDIKRLRSHADVFVVHDTEGSFYGFNKILPKFKYRFVYRRYKKQTTIVSDTIDVAAFFK